MSEMVDAAYHLDTMVARAAVKSVLLALREPTPAMLAAGNAVFHNGTAVSALSVWQAMIDEMLK